MQAPEPSVAAALLRGETAGAEAVLRSDDVSRRQKQQTVPGKHGETENVYNDIRKALLKPQGFPWYLTVETS